MTSPRPGWYTNPSGQLQWWDGTTWGALATENATSPPPPAVTKRYNTWMWVWISIVLVIAIGIPVAGLLMVAASTGASTSSSAPKEQEEEASTSESVPSSPERPASPLPPTRDELMIAEGWQPVESGDTYYRFFNEEEQANSSCGYNPCTWVVITSYSGCPGGFYVKADLLAAGTPVDWTNAISASTLPAEPVVVTLEFFNDSVDSVRLSEIRCMY